MNFIAPGITHEQYDESKQLDVFEGRIKEWILKLAIELSERPDSGIAVLILASSVLEPIGGVLPRGKTANNSEGRFCNGFVHVFPEIPGADDLWKTAQKACDLLRHGLFHEAFIKPGLLICDLDSPIRVASGTICIDPKQFVKAVQASFTELCAQFRSPDLKPEMRHSFDSYWRGKEQDNLKDVSGRRTNVCVGHPTNPMTGTSTAAYSSVSNTTHAVGTYDQLWSESEAFGKNRKASIKE